MDFKGGKPLIIYVGLGKPPASTSYTDTLNAKIAQPVITITDNKNNTWSDSSGTGTITISGNSTKLSFTNVIFKAQPANAHGATSSIEATGSLYSAD